MEETGHAGGRLFRTEDGAARIGLGGVVLAHAAVLGALVLIKGPQIIDSAIR